MAKDRIERNELMAKIVATPGESDDPLRAMAELLADFVMEAEVTQKIRAVPHERSAERKGDHRKHNTTISLSESRPANTSSTETNRDTPPFSPIPKSLHQSPRRMVLLCLVRQGWLRKFSFLLASFRNLDLTGTKSC
jgi:hypothetical protein